MRVAVRILGAIFLLAIAGVILFPIFAPARGGSRKGCLSLAKQLAMANIMYAGENNERLPNGANWMEALKPFSRNEDIYRCYWIKDGLGQYGFAYNRHLSGASMHAFDDLALVPVIWESERTERNASEYIPTPPHNRHPHMFSVGFLAGNANTRLTKSENPP